MHLLTVVGARPQFIKLAPFSAEARARGHRETIVHTGQHYDEGMSARFFDELGIPEPDVNLAVGSGSHGDMTARALIGIEREIQDRKPDVVVVFGDTNSTLAGVLAAVKLHVPSVHVEAGLRSYNRSMPEEINRVVADHTADLLLVPGDSALANLQTEGLADRAEVVGDIMVDGLLAAKDRAPSSEAIVERLDLAPASYALLTVHRASNTDDPGRLRAILAALEGDRQFLFPVHPRTKAAMAAAGAAPPRNVHTIEPLGYIDMVGMLRDAPFIVTDSGGLQKEAYLLGTPCITLREETEWVETVELGWNVLVGSNPASLREALQRPPRGGSQPAIYGDGRAAAAMLDAIERRFRA